MQSAVHLRTRSAVAGARAAALSDTWAAEWAVDTRWAADIRKAQAADTRKAQALDTRKARVADIHKAQVADNHRAQAADNHNAQAAGIRKPREANIRKAHRDPGPAESRDRIPILTK